jgi:hypothetical protein
LLNVNKFYSPGQKNECYLFCIMRKFVQCGKYFRSHAVPPYTRFTVLSWFLCFDVYSRYYQKKKLVGLERGPLSFVSTTEELFLRKSSGSCMENREYGRRDPSRRPRGTLYRAKVGKSSGGRSVGIVRSRAQTMEFSFMF